MIFTQKVNLIGIFVCSPYGQINKIILLPLLDFCLRHLVCLSISQIERVPHPAQCACNAHLVRLFNKCCVAAVMLEIHTEKQLSEFYCSSCQWLIELTIFSNEKKKLFSVKFYSNSTIFTQMSSNLLNTANNERKCGKISLNNEKLFCCQMEW